jgi:hypothetical protein
LGLIVCRNFCSVTVTGHLCQSVKLVQCVTVTGVCWIERNGTVLTGIFNCLSSCLNSCQVKPQQPVANKWPIRMRKIHTCWLLLISQSHCLQNNGWALADDEKYLLHSGLVYRLNKQF